MKVKLIDVTENIFAGGDVPKDRFSEIVTDKYNVPIYANAEKDNGLYGYTDIARVSVPCVTVAARGTIGYTAKRMEPFLPVVRLITAIPDGKKITLDYLYYALRNYRPKSSGTSIPQLTVPDIKNYSFKIVPILRQKEIAQTLDEVELLIKKHRKQIQMLDDLIKSRFVELFGDTVGNSKGYLVKTLQELIDMGYVTYHLDGNHGGDYPRSEEFVDSGIPYISANCIYNGEIDFSRAKYLTTERAGKLRKGIAKNGDVLFAHNATVGPTVVLRTSEVKVILGTSLTAYRCNNEKILPNYLKNYMLSDGFVRQYSGEMKQTTRNQVPITVQKKYLFLIPPIDEQKLFSDFAKQVDKLKVVFRKIRTQWNICKHHKECYQ